MSHTNFLSLAQHLKRNIVNSSQIDNDLTNFVESKNLDNFSNIKKWVKTVVRNYIFQKLETITIDNKELLPQEALELVNQKNILPPYHTVELSAKFMDSISHTIDYLKSSFDNKKDLSRISWEQSQINAKVWLEERLKKISTDEDIENVITLKEIEKDGESYRWVNIRSHKALQRESKLMSHCIESYWETDYPNTKVIAEETPYYSLRDKNNKPLVTLFREVDSRALESFKDNKGLNYDFIVGEIKEKGNAPLSNKNRDLVDMFLEGKQVGMPDYEKTASHYYHTYMSSSKEFGPLKSINQIIRQELKFHSLQPLDITAFENDFPKEKLLAIGNWNKLEVNNKDDFITLHAKEVYASDINARGIVVLSPKFFLKNINKCQIALGSTKDSETIRFFEDIHDTDITLLSRNSIKTYYIFKNCSNINITSRNINQLEDSYINVIKIDSTNINIELPCSKNILELNANNQYNFSIKDGENFIIGNQNEHECENIYLRNKFFTEALNKYLQLQLKNYEDNIIVHNFLSELDIEIINSVSKDITVFSINNKTIRYSTASMLNNFLRDTNETIEKLYDSMDLDTFKNYKNFVIKNAYDILKNDLLDKFPSSESIISAISKHFQDMLIENRPLLTKTLLNADDNFSDYIGTIFPAENKKLAELSSNKLLIYMLKNELVNEANNNYHPDNATNYRFAFTEQRLTKSNCSRWFDFLSSNFFENSLKKEVVQLFIEPYDNNSLVNRFLQLPRGKAETPILAAKLKI